MPRHSSMGPTAEFVRGRSPNPVVRLKDPHGHIPSSSIRSQYPSRRYSRCILTLLPSISGIFRYFQADPYSNILTLPLPRSNNRCTLALNHCALRLRSLQPLHIQPYSLDPTDLQKLVSCFRRITWMASWTSDPAWNVGILCGLGCDSSICHSMELPLSSR